jgi:hypothetical protein
MGVSSPGTRRVDRIEIEYSRFVRPRHTATTAKPLEYITTQDTFCHFPRVPPTEPSPPPMDNYSSLFTMGLLSERASPVSSPRSSFFSKFRKSSLPTKALSKPSEMLYSRGEGRFYPNNDPAPQFTNPFGDSSPAATNELCSFLSLDLAADGSSTARRSSKFLSPLDTSPGTAYSAATSSYVSNATTHEALLTRLLIVACVSQTLWHLYPHLHQDGLPASLSELFPLQDLHHLPLCLKSPLIANLLVLSHQ